MDEKNESIGVKSTIIKLLKSDSKILPAVLLSFLIIILGIYFFISINSKQENIKQQENTALKNTNNSQKSQNVKQAPLVKFEKYTNNNNSVILPGTAKTYELKNNFSVNEVLSFAQKLGLESYKVGNNQNVFVYNLSNKEKKGILEFNKKTGSFSYRSYGDFKPSGYNLNQSSISEAKLFLTELGFDNTITCANTYQRKNRTGLTFVECHRDWNKIKAPIVNLGGLLNIAENKKLSDLYIGKLDKLSPADQQVFNVKSLDVNGNIILNKNDEGYSRPNDFNTITFGIEMDGRIISISSNLRWIDKENVVNSKDIITTEEALALFQNQKAEYSLTVPSGNGVTDFEKVYPGNQAVSDNAIINEISLIFLDKPVDAEQPEYKLSYMIRGTARLRSGYNIKFVQTIPAFRSNLTFDSKTKAVAGTTTDVFKLQLGTFKPTSVKPSITGSQVIPPVPPGPQLPSECSDLDGFELTLNIPNYGTLIVAVSSFSSGYHTIFFKSSSFENQDREKLKDMFFKSVEDQYVINMAKWIKEQKVQPVFNTVSDLYKIFRQIDVPFDPSNGQLSSHCLIIISKYEAPIPLDCTSVEAGGTLDLERAHKITRNVAERLLQLKAENKLGEWAAKENLFSDKTLRGFSMIFDNTPWDKTGLPEHAKIGKCYITGGSPILYLYPPQKTEVNISINTTLIYKDPGVIGNTWNIISYPDGTIERNGIIRSGIYYEYDKSKVQFNEPSTGFIVKTDEWEDFIKNNLSKKLGLNQKETESLITEVNNVLINSSKSPYLKLSFISQSELNQKLPLTINPKPDNLYRINVFVKPVSANLTSWTNLPNLTKRAGFTVVEIGAYSK